MNVRRSLHGHGLNSHSRVLRCHSHDRIYGEDIYDLLDEEAGKEPMTLTGMGMNAPFTQKPSVRKVVRSAKDVAAVMAAGEKHRQITASLDGDGIDLRASQSHTVPVKILQSTFPD